jgi:hypothetical protein
LAVFSLVRSYRNGPRATLCAFDLIEIDGEDLRWRTIEDRKSLLKRLEKENLRPDQVRTIEKVLVEIFRRQGHVVEDDGDGNLCIVEEDYDEDINEHVQIIGLNLSALAWELAEERVLT